MPFASAAVHSQQWKVEIMESTIVGRVLPYGIYQPLTTWTKTGVTLQPRPRLAFVQIEILQICKSKRNMLNCLGIVTWKFIIKSSMDKINCHFLFLFNHQQKAWNLKPEHSFFGKRRYGINNIFGPFFASMMRWWPFFSLVDPSLWVDAIPPMVEESPKKNTWEFYPKKPRNFEKEFDPS